MAAQDPFYLVRDEIQDLANKAQEAYSRFDRLPQSSDDRDELTKEILDGCESVLWQLEELDRAVSVAAKDPARFGIDLSEVEKRKQWTASTRYQIGLVKHSVQSFVKDRQARRAAASKRKVLLMTPEGAVESSSSRAQDKHQIVESEDDQQALLVKEQDDHLDAMSHSLSKIGNMGMAIHEELGSQEVLIGEITDAVDTTQGRLELVQKKMAAVIKKAGFKGQLVMLICLAILFFVLIIMLLYE